MAKINVLVVEDELIISMQICNLLEELGYEVCNQATSYNKAIKCLKKKEPDIALLDIQLEGEKSGIDLAHYIKENVNIPFIFLTSQADHRTVDQAKKLNPPAYLMKPFNRDDLFTSIELAMHNFQTTKQQIKEDDSPKLVVKDAFFIKNSNLFQKVKFSEILFVKSEHVYVELYTVDGKRHLVRTSMNNFIKGLPDGFQRIHRSYTINMDYLEAVGTHYLMIKEHQIPIGASYRESFTKLVQND